MTRMWRMVAAVLCNVNRDDVKIWRPHPPHLKRYPGAASVQKTYCLISAVTGHVGTSTNLSGYPTVRPLGGVLASGM